MPVLLASRGLRGFCDGFVAVLLPSYLLALGHGLVDVGVLSTLTLLGSAAATLGVGALGHRAGASRLLSAAAALMAITGLGFASVSAWWALMVLALVGTLNPSSGDVSVFLPLEHARLAELAQGSDARTRVFARYSLVGSLSAACGALASGVPAWLGTWGVATPLQAMRGMFVLYAAVGLAVWWLYRRLPPADAQVQAAATALGPSKHVVWRLAALFSVDAFAGGLLINALMATFLLQRFGLSLAQAGVFFFCTGLLGTASQLLAPHIAKRIGLVNTMVFTHIPANVFLILAALSPSLPSALVCLFARSLLSQMDVPARSALVMALVTPPERAAAASFTAVPRSLASALAPSLGAAMMAGGALAAPLLWCGGLKIAYDLALWWTFRHHPVD